MKFPTKLYDRHFRRSFFQLLPDAARKAGVSNRRTDCHNQKRMRETVGHVALEVMRKGGYDIIDLGMYGLLDEIYKECEKRGVGKPGVRHPLDRQAYVMARLRKSRLFRLRGYISYTGFKGYAKCALLEEAIATPLPR